ncbi:hypothetical protein SLS64_011200 [Diaporthe eres]
MWGTLTRYSANGDEWYLFTYSTNDNITLRRSKALTDNWDNQETRVVFTPDPRGQDAGQPWSTDLWAPEIHNISGKWYIIFSATPDFDNPPPLQDAACPINCPAINHRMFVLESDGPDPWTAGFTLKSELNTYDQFAIDGTYFIHNQQIYHIYSCWQEQTSAWPANLCITHMSDPWTVDTNLTDRRMISVPNEPWERVPYGRPDTRLATNEGPQQLINPTTGQNFVVYSAARDIYRTVRTQKFSWNDDGTPNFPLAENGPFPVPSGQNGQAAVNERSLTGRLGGLWHGEELVN